MNRVTRIELKNALNIILSNLQENDGGDYKCEAVGDDDQQTQLLESVFVTVKTSEYNYHEINISWYCSDSCLAKRDWFYCMRQWCFK